MTPRTEFTLLSMLMAAAVLVGVLLLMDADRRAPGVRDVLSALRFAPAALLATGAGTWFVTRWHARARSVGRDWKPGGMTLRTLLVVFLLFPVSLAAWAMVALGVDQIMADAPGAMGDAMGWLPVIVFYGSLAALLFGAMPAFILEYFACRRFLRRQAVLSTGHA
jgi:hypothetical protein